MNRESIFAMTRFGQLFNPPYGGPYYVNFEQDKYFTIKVNNVNVSIDRARHTSKLIKMEINQQLQLNRPQHLNNRQNQIRHQILVLASVIHTFIPSIPYYHSSVAYIFILNSFIYNSQSVCHINSSCTYIFKSQSQI